MAQFSDIMEIKHRMCNYYKETMDDRCPLNSVQNMRMKHCMQFIEEYPLEAERIMLEWNKNHPLVTNFNVMINAVRELFDDELITEHISNYLEEFCQNGCVYQNACIENCKYEDFWHKEYKKPEKET